MIIDAHAHLGILGSFSATASDLLRMADRAGIDKMIVSHCDAIFLQLGPFVSAGLQI